MGNRERGGSLGLLRSQAGALDQENTAEAKSVSGGCSLLGSMGGGNSRQRTVLRSGTAVALLDTCQQKRPRLFAGAFASRSTCYRQSISGMATSSKARN